MMSRITVMKLTAPTLKNVFREGLLCTKSVTSYSNNFLVFTAFHIGEVSLMTLGNDFIETLRH